MLSAQLTALELSVFNGFVDGGQLVCAPDATSANAAGFASVDQPGPESCPASF